MGTVPLPQASPQSNPAGCGIIFQMSEEDFSLPPWEQITPEAMKKYTEAKLLYVMALSPGRPHDAWARAELATRQNERISREVAILSTSSERLEGLTKWLLILALVLTALTFPLVVIEVWKLFRP